MATKYVVMTMCFDKIAWGKALNAIDTETRKVAREMSGVSDAGWWHWMNPERPGNVYEYPLMRNFENVCNLLDLDPRTFFVLKED
jgi:hypothetical protein